MIMASPHHAFGRRRQEYGFTIIEMLVYMVVAGIVMAAVYQLLIGQSRSYTKQREVMDVHGTLRAAASLLAWELRQASAARGDLYTIGANSIALRSIQGAAVVCQRTTNQARYGLARTTGEITATVDDTVLVYLGDTQGWNVIELGGIQTGAAQRPDCVWPGYGMADLRADLIVNKKNDTTGVWVGSPFLTFRRVEYALYQEYGRYWLGRKVGAAASYEMMTGPLKATDGLVFVYRDAAGVVTTQPNEVATIEVVLRAESYVELQTGGRQQDSVAIKIALRS